MPQLRAESNMPLLWVVRDVLSLTGTKFGYGVGACGACTVHLDSQAIRSCITVLADTAGRDITTIEGRSLDGNHPIQRAWISNNIARESAHH